MRLHVQAILTALALIAACAKPLPPGAVKTVVDRSREGKRVLFVGLDGADWKLLDPLMADGTMPELARIVARAERRVLLTLSPLVWTSMMTGVSPLEHRILDFTRFHPRTRQQEPITSDERAVPAIWNMVRAGGKRAAVFGLWATFPVIASDHGFDWGGVHEESSTATATAAKWHRTEGVWIRWPRHPAQLEPARVDQVCATLLEVLGLPRGEGIAEAIGGSSAQTVNYRRFYRRSPSADGANTSEQVAKLEALGYLSPGAANPTSTRTPQSSNNEGLLLGEAKRIDEAERAFREALQLDPRYASARSNLDDLLSTRGLERLRAHDCKNALADFRAIHRETALGWAALAAAEGCLGNEQAAVEAFARARALDPAIDVQAPPHE